jgi:hypothetical protein
METGQVLSPTRARPLRTRVAALLAEADVRLDGSRPWDLQVRDPRLFARVLAQGSLGLGEAYMDGDWDSDSLERGRSKACSWWRTGTTSAPTTT